LLVEPARNRGRILVIDLSSPKDLFSLAGSVSFTLESIKSEKRLVSNYARAVSAIMKEAKGTAEDETNSERVRNASFIFLSMPDPTMISTAIGVTTFIASRGLHALERRKHGYMEVFKVYRKIRMELYELID